MPETFEGDELSLMNHPDGCTGKSALRDAGAQDVKSMMELFVLPAESVGQEVIGTLVQKMSSCCFCFRFITHSVHR